MGNGSWRISRSRGRARLPLAVVAILAVTIILFGKVQSSLFDQARTNVADWMRPALTITSIPTQAVRRWLSSVGDFFWVYQENVRLKEENERLRQWRNRAVILNDRLKRYQLLLNAVPDPGMHSVAARVIGRANSPFQHTMILDAGRSSGIKPGQAVIDQRGMIGRIYLAGERTSWVILLTDPNSRIPVTIEPTPDQAIMTGDNDPMPLIETLARGVQLKPESQVVTSGDGDILPAGIPVGVIVASDGQYRVNLFADHTTAQDVEIVDFAVKPEALPAMTPQDLPVTAAGLPPASPPRGTGSSPAVVQPPPPVYVPPAPKPPKPDAAAAESGNDVPDTGNR